MNITTTVAAIGALLLVACSGVASPQDSATNLREPGIVPTPTFVTVPSPPTYDPTAIPIPVQSSPILLPTVTPQSTATRPAQQKTRPPTSTPDSEATVQAMVSEALTKLPEPTPLYWPTPEDFKAVAYNTIDKAFEGQGFGSGNIYRDRVDEDHGQYVAVYLAKECLAHGELSFDSFRSFIDQTYLRVQSADGLPVLNVTARSVISHLLITSALEESGLSLASDGCTRRYFYPTSGSEAFLAIDLVKATGVKATVSPFLMSNFDDAFERGAYRWFDPVTAKGRPFLPWLCEGEWWGSKLCVALEK